MYNASLAAMRVMLGLASSTTSSDTDLGYFVTIADGIITGYNASPPSGVAAAIELSLCRRLIYQSKLLSTYNPQNGLTMIPGELMRPVVLTKEEKAQLDGDSQIWVEEESWN